MDLTECVVIVLHNNDVASCKLGNWCMANSLKLDRVRNFRADTESVNDEFHLFSCTNYCSWHQTMSQSVSSPFLESHATYGLMAS